jgi:hypothetical protein
MKKTFLALLLLLAFVAARAVVMDPVVTTDKSINTYSMETVAKSVIKDSMTNEQKLAALFSAHRRLMHHFRLHANTEDNVSSTDGTRLYNV